MALSSIKDIKEFLLLKLIYLSQIFFSSFQHKDVFTKISLKLMGIDCKLKFILSTSKYRLWKYIFFLG